MHPQLGHLGVFFEDFEDNTYNPKTPNANAINGHTI